LLLIVGGYIALKNTLDCRIVKRNTKKYNLESNEKKDIYVENKEVINTVGVRRGKRNIRVRKKEKH
jgi:hypothetical protein